MKRRLGAFVLTTFLVFGACTDDGGIDFEWVFDAFLVRDITQDADPVMRAAAAAKKEKEAEEAAQRKLDEARTAIGRVGQDGTDQDVTDLLEEAVTLRPRDPRYHINQILWELTVNPSMSTFAAIQQSQSLHAAVFGELSADEATRRWQELWIEASGSLASQLPPGSDRRRRMTAFFCGIVGLHRDTYGNLAETQTFLLFIDQSPCS